MLLNALDVVNGLMDVRPSDHHLVDPGREPIIDADHMVACLNKGPAVEHI